MAYWSRVPTADTLLRRWICFLEQSCLEYATHSRDIDHEFCITHTSYERFRRLYCPQWLQELRAFYRPYYWKRLREDVGSFRVVWRHLAEVLGWAYRKGFSYHHRQQESVLFLTTKKTDVVDGRDSGSVRDHPGAASAPVDRSEQASGLCPANDPGV